MVSQKTQKALKEAKETCKTIIEVSKVCDKYNVSNKDRAAICGYMRDRLSRIEMAKELNK